MVAEKKENSFINLIINILIPAFILSKGNAYAGLTPLQGLLIALSFPLIYGIYSMLVLKKTNFISILGFVSVLLSGLVGVFEFPPEWIAVKEAAIPLIIGIAVFVSSFTSFPVATKMIYNKEIFDLELIESKLNATSKELLESKLHSVSYFIAGSFFLSAFLNYALAKFLVTSMPGTEAFNEELGKMTFWSFPVIAVPSMLIMLFAFWKLYKSINQLTELSFEEMLIVKTK